VYNFPFRRMKSQPHVTLLKQASKQSIGTWGALDFRETERNGSHFGDRAEIPTLGTGDENFDKLQYLCRPCTRCNSELLVGNRDLHLQGTQEVRLKCSEWENSLGMGWNDFVSKRKWVRWSESHFIRDQSRVSKRSASSFDEADDAAPAFLPARSGARANPGLGIRVLGSGSWDQGSGSGYNTGYRL